MGKTFALSVELVVKAMWAKFGMSVLFWSSDLYKFRPKWWLRAILSIFRSFFFPCRYVLNVCAVQPTMAAILYRTKLDQLVYSFFYSLCTNSAGIVAYKKSLPPVFVVPGFALSYLTVRTILKKETRMLGCICQWWPQQWEDQGTKTNTSHVWLFHL